MIREGNVTIFLTPQKNQIKHNTGQLPGIRVVYGDRVGLISGEAGIYSRTRLPQLLMDIR